MLKQVEQESDFLLDEQFKQHINDIIAKYFSRDPQYWPIFKEPGLAHIINTRKVAIQCNDPIKNYNRYNHEISCEYLENFQHFNESGIAMYDHIRTAEDIPLNSKLPGGDSIDELLLFSGSLSKNWENPGSVENVITMPCDPAIYASSVAILSNPNLVYKEYCGMSEDLERYVVRLIAKLAGYDPKQAAGIFTSGGTFCNLYGYLLGIRKTMPHARLYGLNSHTDYEFINSQGGHYSNTTCLSLLGVNIKEKCVRIKVNQNNNIDLDDFRAQLTDCFRRCKTVPCIMLTLGTTDTFGLDEIKPVYDIRQELCEKYDIEPHRWPHIHVDAAIGWTMLFFQKYDFDNNPLHINKVTLNGLQRNLELFEQIKYADSFTVDFHKWGYVPYTSSVVMIKNRKDMDSLANCPENFTYFEEEQQGLTHLQSTIECSRGAQGIYGAYGALKYLGIEGYQAILAHCLQNANYFRHRLDEFEEVKVLAYQNQGPSVAFRIYNRDYIECAEAEFEYEYGYHNDPVYLARLEKNTLWHRNIFITRGKVGLFTNWVEYICHTDYDRNHHYSYIPGEKAVFMNPKTTLQEIDLFLEHLLG